MLIYETEQTPSMASKTGDSNEDAEGVEFIYEDDGSVTARDLETDIASFGESKSEALRMLSEALKLEEGKGKSITDEDLREFGLDPDESGNEELPDFMK